MLDMGFKPAVSRIVAQTPDDRQTLFFSATLEGATGKLAAAYTHKARRHTQQPPSDSDRRHRAQLRPRRVPERQARPPDRAAERSRAGRTLVFVRTKRGADRLVKRLRSREVDAVAMHGDKSQGQRERALARFEKGEVDTLIATDVAARGIDVADVTHVINFDAPGDQDAYTHRIGSTGRAGNRGAGISFVLEDQVGEMSKIARDLGLAREFDLGRPDGTGRPKPLRPPAPAAPTPTATATPPPPRSAGAVVVAARQRWPHEHRNRTRNREEVDLQPVRRLGRPHGRPARRLPETWDRNEDGIFCLNCRRDRAAQAALESAPDDSPIEVRAKLRRAALIEFEVSRRPDHGDGAIAKACRSSVSAVAAARQRLNLPAPDPQPTKRR